MGADLHDCVFGWRHVFTVAVRAAFGSYWPSPGDVDRRGVVYRHLSGDFAGAKHRAIYFPAIPARGQLVLYWRGRLCGNSGIVRGGGVYQNHGADGECGAHCAATRPFGWGRVDPLRAVGNHVCAICSTGGVLFLRLTPRDAGNRDASG
ncbi:hypothetical protein D3C75_601590 [compost metagenome]